jgi:Fe2+ transport system protein FeoA
VDGFNLGLWVANQRAFKNRLTPDLKQRLSDIGFVMHPHEKAWEEGFNKLLQFKGVEGHCVVPARFKLEGFYLGYWVMGQRTRKEKLTSERRQRLDELGFVWNVLAAWEEGFSKLLQFKEAEGHCMVPAKHKEEGYGLGIWVGTQRSKSETLSAERRQKLDDLGFVWAVSKD